MGKPVPAKHVQELSRIIVGPDPVSASPCVVCGGPVPLNWAQCQMEVMDPETGQYRHGVTHIGCTSENKLRPAEAFVRQALRDALFLVKHRDDPTLHPDAWEMWTVHAEKTLALNGLIR